MPSSACSFSNSPATGKTGQMMETDQPPQLHMQYIVDLEVYSLLLRPGDADTEVIQYKRSEYTPAAAADLFEQIRAELPRTHPSRTDTESIHSATLVFVYMLATTQLRTMRCVDAAGEHWFARDADSGVVYDFGAQEHANTEAIHAHGEAIAAGGIDSCPLEASFDLLERVQPSAQRYMVDELITLGTLETSEFLTQKKAMDYLYQRGVFGKL